MNFYDLKWPHMAFDEANWPVKNIPSYSPEMRCVLIFLLGWNKKDCSIFSKNWGSITEMHPTEP